MAESWICKIHHRKVDRGAECHWCIATERDRLRLQVDDLKAAGRNARDDATAALDLVSRIRMALNDNGKRMQDELLAYCRDLAQMPYRIQKLREGILEARREGCACDFHLYGEDQELDSDDALDAYCTMEQALNEANATEEKYRAALETIADPSTVCMSWSETVHCLRAHARNALKPVIP